MSSSRLLPQVRLRSNLLLKGYFQQSWRNLRLNNSTFWRSWICFKTIKSSTDCSSRFSRRSSLYDICRVSSVSLILQPFLIRHMFQNFDICILLYKVLYPIHTLLHRVNMYVQVHLICLRTSNYKVLELKYAPSLKKKLRGVKKIY